MMVLLLAFVACGPEPLSDLSELHGLWEGTYDDVVDYSLEPATLTLVVSDFTDWGALVVEYDDVSDFTVSCSLEIPRSGHLRMYDCERSTWPADGDDPVTTSEREWAFTSVQIDGLMLYMDNLILERGDLLVLEEGDPE